MAVEQVLKSKTVANFETTFLGLGPHGATGIPKSVSVPSDASDLLEKSARLLRIPRGNQNESVTGPLVQVRHVPGDTFGEVALQTIRSGRQAEVRVRVSENRIDEVLEWMKTSRTVVVEGQLIRDPGRPLKIDRPIRIFPLDESFLFHSEGSSAPGDV